MITLLLVGRRSVVVPEMSSSSSDTPDRPPALGSLSVDFKGDEGGASPPALSLWGCEINGPSAEWCCFQLPGDEYVNLFT